jgi:hypothetical protein
MARLVNNYDSFFYCVLLPALAEEHFQTALQVLGDIVPTIGSALVNIVLNMVNIGIEIEYTESFNILNVSIANEGDLDLQSLAKLLNNGINNRRELFFGSLEPMLHRLRCIHYKG